VLTLHPLRPFGLQPYQFRGMGGLITGAKHNQLKVKAAKSVAQGPAQVEVAAISSTESPWSPWF
jgi:hypothetical protein